MTLAATPDALAALEGVHKALGSIAEGCNSITDNAKHWSLEYTAAYARQLRIEVEDVGKVVMMLGAQ